MAKILGIIKWTKACFEVWWNNMPNVTQGTVYWWQTQSFFPTEQLREEYKLAEQKMIEKYKRFHPQEFRD